MKKPDKSDKPKVYKKEQFNEFVKILRKGHLGKWTVVAEALGISRETLVQWKKLPEAKKALVEGIVKGMV